MIDIGTVLNKFNDMVDEQTSAVKEYGIRFLTAEGEVREMKCRKNVKMPKAGLNDAPEERGKMRYNLKLNGVMLVQDLEAMAPRSVKVACILQFKDFLKEHWEDVKH